MRFGIRQPSITRSLKARTTGRVKRAAKRAVNPVYGKKGVGFIKSPSRSIKNAIYRRTTVGVSDIAKGGCALSLLVLATALVLATVATAVL